MKPVVRAIVRRDVKRWFSDPTGYVFIALFVLLCAIGLFWVNDDFFNNNLANFTPLNDVFPVLLLFIIPAITMTVWASERNKGTDELLLTLPATDAQIILGKFLAAVGIYTTALFFCFPLLAALMYLGSPDLGLLFCNFVGYWMLGTTLLAVGMVGSQLSDNVTVAFILGVLLCALVVFSERFLPSSWDRFGPLAQFEELARGKLTLAAVLLFLATTVAFLYMNHVILSSRHWRGRAGVGLHLGARFACLLVVAAALSIGGANLGCHGDATSEKIHSLSPETRRLIAELDPRQPVILQAYVSPPSDVPREFVETAETLRNLLAEIDDLGGDKVEVNVTETERYTEEARDAEERFQIRFQTVGTERDGRPDQADLFLGVAITSGLEQTIIPFLHRGLSVEYELCRSIRYVCGLRTYWMPERVGPAFASRDRAQDWGDANWSDTEFQVEERGDAFLARAEGPRFEQRDAAEAWARNNWLADWTPYSVQEVGGSHRVEARGPDFDDTATAEAWIEDHLGGGPFEETEVVSRNERSVPVGRSPAFASDTEARAWAAANLAASDEIRIAGRQMRRKVGILDNDIKIFGDFDQASMRSTPAWQIKDELELQYDVTRVSVDSDYPGDLDALIALMPSSLNQEQLDRLEGYVMAGNPTLLIDDPWPWSAPGMAPSDPKGGNRNPFTSQGQPPPEPKGDIEAFLRRLDLRWNKDQLAWDSYNPHPNLSRVEEEVIFVAVDSGSKEPFAKASPITSGLQELMLWFPGVVEDELSFLERSILRAQRNIDRKREEISELKARITKAQAETDKWDAEVKAAGEAATREQQFQLLLANRTLNSLKNERSLLEGDIPRLESQIQTTDSQIERAREAMRERGTRATVLLRSSPDSGVLAVEEAIDKGFPPFQPPRPRPGRKLAVDSFEQNLAYKVVQDRGDGRRPVKTIFIADLDFMSDQFFEIRRMGLEYIPQLDNITFLLNCVDDLAGDDTFIELRKRRPRHRSLTLIEDKERAFEEDWLLAKAEAEKKAEEELEDAQDRLDERVLEIEENPNLDAQSKEIQKASVQAVEQRRLDLAKARIDGEKNRELELAKTEKLDAIRGIHTQVKTLWAGLAPLPAVLVGLLAFMMRRSRERSTMRSAGGR